MDGLLFRRYCASLGEAMGYLNMLLQTGILRCTSPHREALCDKPAKTIFWQDGQEWYLCCEDHADFGEQWTGSTRFVPMNVEALVIKEPAMAWLEKQRPDVRRQIKAEEYERPQGPRAIEITDVEGGNGDGR